MSASVNWLIIAILIAVNALFVVSEIAIIAAKRSRLEFLKEHGSNGASMAIKLKQMPEFFLSTVQVAITFLTILIGTFTGEQMISGVVDILIKFNISQEVSDAIAHAFIVVAITYLTVLGELVPKRIALYYPEPVAIALSPLMRFTGMLFYPVVKSLDLSTKSLLWMMRLKKPQKHEEASVEDLRFILKQAKIGGTLAETEHDILRRIINLNDMQVGSIMTPRQKIISLDHADPQEKILQCIELSTHNFLPVIEGDFASVDGVISARKYLLNSYKEAKASKAPKPAKSSSTSAKSDKNKSAAVENANNRLVQAYVNYVYVPDLTKVSNLIEQMRTHMAQVAIVVDEYGSIEGMVTISDIFKIFISDLANLYEERTSEIRKLKNGYIVDGNIATDEVMELMGITSLPGDDEEEYRTLASFLLKQLSRLPVVGDKVSLQSWEFKITKMDNKRIAKVHILKLAEKRTGKI